VLLVCFVFVDIDRQMRHFEDVVEEIKAKVDHLQPFMLGKSNLPSTGYCLLYKLFTMKITVQQLKSTNYFLSYFINLFPVSEIVFSPVI
jgi:hypothetical protein